MSAPDDKRGFIVRRPCPACGVPVGVRAVDVTAGVVQCPVCEARAGVEVERSEHDGLFRGGNAVVLTMQAPLAFAEATAPSKRVSIRDEGGTRTITLTGRPHSRGRAAASGAAIALMVLAYALVDGVALGIAAALAGILGAVVTPLLTLLNPACEVLRIDNDGVELLASTRGGGTRLVVRAAETPAVEMITTHFGDARLAVTIRGECHLLGDATDLPAADATWLAEHLRLYLVDEEADESEIEIAADPTLRRCGRQAANLHVGAPAPISPAGTAARR